jgi:hypothetical protein
MKNKIQVATLFPQASSNQEVSIHLLQHRRFDALKTLLKTQGISLTAEKAISGQIGQSQVRKYLT